jgi:hypothetical protein
VAVVAPSTLAVLIVAHGSRHRCRMRDEGLRSPASVDHDDDHHAVSTTTICVENPQAQQWAQQAKSDTQAGVAIDQQLLRDDPNSEQYNADYERLQNADQLLTLDRSKHATASSESRAHR